MRKGGLSLGILGSKPVLLIMVPLGAWILTNLWGVTSTLVQTKSYDALYQFLKQFILLALGGQTLTYTSVQTLRMATETQAILYNLQLVVGGSLMTLLLIILGWKTMKTVASGSFQGFNVFAKGVLLITVVGAVGLAGVLTHFLTTGQIVMPFHGTWELAKLSAEWGYEFTVWLLTGVG